MTWRLKKEQENRDTERYVHKCRKPDGRQRNQEQNRNEIQNKYMYRRENRNYTEEQTTVRRKRGAETETEK